MRARRLIGAVLASAAALSIGAVALLRYELGADTSFDTRVPRPALAARAPRVLFDHGHRNVHAAHGRYGPFVRLIEADGCRVTSSSGTLTPASLSGAGILVIVNAKGPKDDQAASAFSPEECDAVRDWVRAGGSLLLVADHHPCGEAAAALASRLGVEMSGGWTDDEAHARAGGGDPGQIVFSRENGLLADHAITRGREPSEAVATAESFTGQSLKGPPECSPLLVLADTAMDRVPVSSQSSTQGSRTVTTFQTDDRSAAGRCQGLAMLFGKGRLVVLGEAAMLSAQVDDKTGRRFGMNAAGNDNRALALNIVRWLAGAL
jgi:hypothetical protein